MADKPAKSSILNMQGHSSTYFCSLCTKMNNFSYINGKRHVHFDLNQTSIKRTSSGYSALAYSAEESNCPDYGVKGYNFLQSITSLNIIESVLVDYMHSVCLGVFKRIIQLVFFTNDTPVQVNLKRYVSFFDSSIREFRFSSTINNMPPLLKNFKLWKAKDFENFFFFIFLHIIDKDKYPLLVELLNDLIVGLKLLFSDKIGTSLADRSNSFQKSFLLKFSANFGSHNLKPVFHDLEHIVETCMKSGPIWQYSGFNFENSNRLFKNLSKNNKRIDSQIVKKLESIQINYHCEIAPSDIRIKRILSRMFEKKSWKPTFSVNSSIRSCGKKVRVSSNDMTFADSHSTNIYFEVKRILIGKLKVSTIYYDMNKQFLNSIFLNKSTNRIIEFERIFLELSENNSRAIGICKIFDSEPSNFGSFIKKEIISQKVVDFVNFENDHNPCSVLKRVLYTAGFNWSTWLLNTLF